MYVVAAQYYAKEGKDNEVAAILQTMIPISRAEPGCALYLVNRRSTTRGSSCSTSTTTTNRATRRTWPLTAFKENILGKVVPMLESRVRDFYDLVD